MDVAKETASKMADITKLTLRYMGGEPYVSSEGMEMLTDLFSKVPDELKAATFECYLVELQDRDIDYNIENFIQNA